MSYVNITTVKKLAKNGGWTQRPYLSPYYLLIPDISKTKSRAFFNASQFAISFSRTFATQDVLCPCVDLSKLSNSP